MEKTLEVAKFLYDSYRKRYGEQMDEMKMHKLMYFLQRESLMQKEERLFDGVFYGWKYGPVLKEVRTEYQRNNPFLESKGNVSQNTRTLVDNVLSRYGSLSSWKLSSLSHEEFSWKNARKELDFSDNGDNPLSLEAMKVDAAKEKARRKKCETV